MVRPGVDTSVILDATARVIAERGIEGVRMGAVAERAGVAKGVLYLRFTDKHDLLRAVVDREFVLATRHAADLVAADPGGGAFSRLYVHSLSALHARPALLRLYRDPATALRALATDADTDRVRRRTLIGADFLRTLQDTGIVTGDLDADVLAENLTLWSLALAARAPHGDVDALILGMGDLVARAVDTDIADTTPGKRAFSAMAEALIEERERSCTP
ncbi:TetR/AcrR family transcriptional regulator [Nocardiopsis sp. MG754419]|uniref:TetR/AcrR family transcriptional regulator n=1 Tax=Nocardiopsis sp. MG754419 TaxID=2259865 RepID=UPI001BA7755A|nr:TetR/AcrR family transcriptional regulator [Nocardiopsis sp. MG754419]